VAAVSRALQLGKAYFLLVLGRTYSAHHNSHEHMVSMIIGWLLDETERSMLLSRFPPHYANVVAHHVTLRPNAPSHMPLPAATTAEIVGEADDGRGVQALVVSIGGTVKRPDGGTYHITWSLDRRSGRKPVESNHLIAKHGWSKCEPIPIRLQPACF
jgi:hypothetical protein